MHFRGLSLLLLAIVGVTLATDVTIEFRPCEGHAGVTAKRLWCDDGQLYNSGYVCRDDMTCYPPSDFCIQPSDPEYMIEQAKNYLYESNACANVDEASYRINQYFRTSERCARQRQFWN